MAGKKILVVDDEKDMVKTASFRLEKSGYKVISAYDGIEGFEKAKKENPDLIILDIMLPKMDGYRVCTLLKRDKRYNKIPIVMFSARAKDADKKIWQEEIGADAYIEKPFEYKTMLGKVKELLKE